MADVQHAAIADAYLHECKGFATAAVNTIRVANGSGGGAQVALGNFQREVVTAFFTDVSTASSQWLVLPFAGDIVKIYLVADGTTTGTSVFSFEIGGVAVTSGGINLTAGAAGVVFTATPSAANTVTAGQALEMISDGGSTNTVNARLTFIIDVSP